MMTKICKSLIFLFVTVLLLLPYSSAYGLDYGVNLGIFKKFPEEKIPALVKLLKDAGVDRVRISFRWVDIETTNNVFDFNYHDKIVRILQDRGIKVHGVLAGAPPWATGGNDTASVPQGIDDWRDYVETVVLRYNGKVDSWEVYNEVDIPKFWKGTPKEFVTLLKEASEIIRRVSKGTSVVCPGLNGNGEKGKKWLPKLLDLRYHDYCDILAFNPYGKTPNMSLARVKNIRAYLDRYDVKKPLWFTEVGWHSGIWPSGPRFMMVKDDNVRGRYLHETYELLKPYADAIFWYKSVDPPKGFGLIELRDGDLIETPPYHYFKKLTGSSGDNNGAKN